MKSLLISLLFFTFACAILEFPFKNGNIKLEGATVDVLIGTPPQPVKLQLSLYDFCEGLTIGSKGPNNKDFNVSKSTSWKKTGTFDDTDGCSGTDKIVIKNAAGDDQTIENAPFNIADDGVCDDEATLALAHTTDTYTNAFLDQVLTGTADNDQVVVLTFDTVPKNESQGSTGKVTIGSRLTDICPVWHTFPEVVATIGPQWQIKVDKVSLGKFSANFPSTTRINIYYPYFSLSNQTYGSIATQLGLDKNGELPCDIPKIPDNDIVFTFDHFDLRITPDDYLDTVNPKTQRCKFFGTESDMGHFELPIAIYSRYCLMFDIKNQQVGFAEKAPA